ncbi:methanogenic corrinoid protein MtbC1 [Salsuginibacillus halophilus]|uniref:Methanogenic corrinoid protein MtbC1 n=1 Tax=Salsuginibacillus halophilus TaxID=517424 RepID=A0A2P8HWB1_9BACI|nr:cobalamin-dependent protein [Salsuginibacillus halophilus]PSL50464.1 methanogenic corrinoid protein MtbC1 [Salsuginibacillus halophilus]
MSTAEGKYNIKAVSHMLGIPPGTLRAWERRYDIIDPVRNDAGHRLYSDEHVAILRWLADKVNRGFTIGQAVDLLEADNISYVSEVQQSPEDQTARIADDLLFALLHFQEDEAQKCLNQAFSLFTVDKVITEILGAVMVNVGALWEEGKITIAHEHFASYFLHVKLGTMLQAQIPQPYLPKVMAVCAPGEEHELGLLMFSIFLKQKGMQIIYLGQGVPPSDVASAVKEAGVDVVLTTCTMQGNIRRMEKMIEEIEQKNPNVTFAIGGYGLNQQATVSSRLAPFVIGRTKEEWERWVNDLLKVHLKKK